MTDRYKQPSSGDELLEAQRALRRRMSAMPEHVVRCTQAGGYVGVRLRPPPPLQDHRLAAVWLEIYDAECRRLGRSPGLGRVSMAACKRLGLPITSQAKANDKCRAALVAAGRADWYRWAKVKSGRQS